MSKTEMQSERSESNEITQEGEEFNADAKSPTHDETEQLDTGQPVVGLRFVLLITSIFLAAFITGYDTSCIATLTPIITGQFNALQDLGWYTVSYILGQSATMLVYGQLYTLFSMKMLFLLSLLLFVAGSSLTAAAPSSPILIVGRTLNGVASAGALAGTTIILAHTIPLERRPLFFAIVGGAETSALAFGPLLSGAIAHASTWRVAFWINVPVVAATIVLVIFAVDHLRHAEHAHLTTTAALKRIDWIGFALNIPMTLCLVIGLQWAGVVLPWNNWRVILLLTLAGMLFFGFLAAEHLQGDKSMVPLKMLRNRSVALSSIIMFCNYAHLSVIAYYLPIYFQAIRGVDTVTSGVMYLPCAVALGVGGLIGGPLMTRLGYYNPVLIFGSVLMIIGAGLITTFAVDTSAAQWITYQIIYGFGTGLAYQTPFIAVQTVLEQNVVPMALVMLNFSQQFGGIIILSIAQNVFLSRLTQNLTQMLPSVSSDSLLKSGALSIVDEVSPADGPIVLLAYNNALTQAWYIVLGLTCIVIVSAFGVEWRSIKKLSASAT